jgi:hypothetical protein
MAKHKYNDQFDRWDPGGDEDYRSLSRKAEAAAQQWASAQRKS